MTLEQITAVVTIVVTFIAGKLAKRFNWPTKEYIPVQNMAIGILAGIIAYMAGLNDNAVTSICMCMLCSFATGGAYDLGKVGDKT